MQMDSIKLLTGILNTIIIIKQHLFGRICDYKQPVRKILNTNERRHLKMN